MKGKNAAIIVGAAAGVGALILLSRGAGAVPPPEPPPGGMAILYGRVTNSQTGNGIFGVRVTTTGAITETDSNGYYAALNIPPGSWGVRFEKDGYETEEVTVSIQEGNNGLNMQLVPTGVPVADIRVEDLVITPSQVQVGSPVTISVIATNYGTAAGSKTITCTVS